MRMIDNSLETINLDNLESDIVNKFILLIVSRKISNKENKPAMCTMREQNGYFVFTIIIDKSYEEAMQSYLSTKISNSYAITRKASMIHEFCHFIAFSHEIHLNNLDIGKIKERFKELTRKGLVFKEISKLIFESQNTDLKEYESSHFSYKSSDHVDYINIFENLLLPNNELKECVKKIKNEYIGKTSKDYLLLIFKDLFDNLLLSKPFITKRIMKELKLILDELTK